MNLSPIQNEIIQIPGNLVVRASAGTGKTHTMVNKIVKEIQDNKSHKVIAAITFTIKAAQEIRNRLSLDISNHFIGTNNSFVIEEIIQPFMKDVYGKDFDLKLSTDYSIKVETYQEGIVKIKYKQILCSYNDNKRNFIFDLAQEIVKKSLACKLYLQAKYFKIYIDEYQDCDKSMHDFFMYLCDELCLDTFIVGDEKQSIYIWRGAFPEAFKSIWHKSNFKKKFMGENFRSCQQIQNYSNLLCEETRNLYIPTKNLENIIWLNTSSFNWAHQVITQLDKNKKSALLRYTNKDAQTCAEELTMKGVDYIFIPQIPIANITTDTAWLYSAIAKFLILEKYSVYDVISEIPTEGDESLKVVSRINKFLNFIEQSKGNKDEFYAKVNNFAQYLNYETRDDHLEKLFQTISDETYHVAFEAEKFQHIAITFHSSKGLEFEQVIIFATDYNLSDMMGIYNHYVSVTRAKNKLIIIKNNDYYSNRFQSNLESLFSRSGLSLPDIISFPTID